MCFSFDFWSSNKIVIVVLFLLYAVCCCCCFFFLVCRFWTSWNYQTYYCITDSVLGYMLLSHAIVVFQLHFVFPISWNCFSGRMRDGWVPYTSTHFMPIDRPNKLNESQRFLICFSFTQGEALRDIFLNFTSRIYQSCGLYFNHIYSWKRVNIRFS